MYNALGHLAKVLDTLNSGESALSLCYLVIHMIRLPTAAYRAPLWRIIFGAIATEIQRIKDLYNMKLQDGLTPRREPQPYDEIVDDSSARVRAV